MSVAPQIPNWVPDAARRQITELWAYPWLDDAERKLLDRLATYPAMKTGVWKKLPSEPKDFEGNIINWAWAAFVWFRRRPPPYPKEIKSKAKASAKWGDWAKHLPMHPLPDFRHTSGLVRTRRMGIRDRNTPRPSASAWRFGYCFIPLFSAPGCALNAASLSTCQ